MPDEVTGGRRIETRAPPGADLQSQLTEAQKVQLVGLVAAGIAHDFNNVMAVILGQAGMLLNETLSAKQQKRVEAIHHAGERAAGLARRLLAFSRRQTVEPRVFELNGLISDLAKMLRRLLREDIELVTRLRANPGTIQADPSQIEQAIINLVVNARDAMPHGGTLTIDTASATGDAGVAGTTPTGATREFVRLTVTDTGSGMTEEVKARLFEPLFTTKEPGKGTGLGLATVHAIVKGSGGEITCASDVGRGTTFRILLPLVRAEVTPAPDRWVYGDLPHGTETVLLVEDDAEIRDIAREVLARQGYLILEARDAAHALRLSRDHHGPIDLLVTDVVMPGMGGYKLAEQLSAERPGTRVLYVSGHTDDVIAQTGPLHGDLAFMTKPFTPLDLTRKVRETLDARSPGRAPSPPDAARATRAS